MGICFVYCTYTYYITLIKFCQYMSHSDIIELQAHDEKIMASIGRNLVRSLYDKPVTIGCIGSLGAGKTTCIRGLARGLGIEEPITSPSFALEQRYGNVLVHLDLYRLKQSEVAALLAESDDFPGVRVVEWFDQARGTTLIPDVILTIEEREQGGRCVRIEFKDAAIPDTQQIEEWYKEVAIQTHIQEHMGAVTHIADATARHLLLRNIPVRAKALHAAARCHDLLRYVDFDSWDGNSIGPAPSPEARIIWSRMRETYGRPHEAAAEQFLRKKGCSIIGRIVGAHRGDIALQPLDATIEQLALAYADKRTSFQHIVSLQERFEDLARRYDGGALSEQRAAIQRGMMAVEAWLFPDGNVPL